MYVSEILDSLWGLGFCTIGDVTFDSAAYVARYVMKKVTGDAADEHYSRVDPETGEIYKIKPEYTTMSRRPGIAHGWYEKYKDDVFPNDMVVLNGHKMKPPRYYDGLYEIDDVDAFEALKSQRKRDALKFVDNNTPERLAIREQVKLAQIKKLERPLD